MLPVLPFEFRAATDAHRCDGDYRVPRRATRQLSQTAGEKRITLFLLYNGVFEAGTRRLVPWTRKLPAQRIICIRVVTVISLLSHMLCNKVILRDGRIRPFWADNATPTPTTTSTRLGTTKRRQTAKRSGCCFGGMDQRITTLRPNVRRGLRLQNHSCMINSISGSCQRQGATTLVWALKDPLPSTLATKYHTTLPVGDTSH